MVTGTSEMRLPSSDALPLPRRLTGTMIRSSFPFTAVAVQFAVAANGRSHQGENDVIDAGIGT